MRCDDVRAILEEIRSDEVPDSVRGHLAGCAECSGWWRERRLVSAGFRALGEEPAPEPSFGFPARVLRRLEEAADAGRGVADFWERAGRRVVWATLLVTLTVLLALVLPSSGPVRGPDEAEFLLARPEVATVRSEPIIGVDSREIFDPAPVPAGVEREKK